MGQRINAIGFRLDYNKNWFSQWYCSSLNYARLASNDLKIRTFLEGLFVKQDFILGEVRISRNHVLYEVVVNIEVGIQEAPDIVVYDQLLKDCQIGLDRLEECKVHVRVWMTVLGGNSVVRMSATLLANVLAYNLEKQKFLPLVEKQLKGFLPRLTSVRPIQAQGRPVSRTKGFPAANRPLINPYPLAGSVSINNKGVRGLRVEFAGRFTRKGRRAKSRLLQYGVVPTQTIRASVDYCGTYAITRYGSVGIKVWLYK